MSFLWREKPDGTRALGYPVYLAGGLAALGAILLLRGRVSPELMTGRRIRGRGADVAAVTEAAARIVPLSPSRRPPSPAERSFRLHADDERPSDAPGAHRSGFDAIHAVLHREPPPGATGPAYAPLPPAFANDDGAGRAQLLGYRDTGADDPPPASRSISAASAPTVWLARGSLIPVCVLTTVDTSNPAALIEFGIARDVAAHGRLRLEFGTRLLGRLEGHPRRDRLNLSIDTVLYADGSQRPIRASAVEADDTGSNVRPGVAATFVPPPAWAQAAPYISDFATGFLSLLQSRAQQGFAVGIGGVTVQSSLPADAKAPAYQASVQAIGDYTAARLHEIEERYAAYYLVPAGTACWVQLDTDFDGPPFSHARS